MLAVLHRWATSFGGLSEAGRETHSSAKGHASRPDKYPYISAPYIAPVPKNVIADLSSVSDGAKDSDFVVVADLNSEN